MFSEKFLSERKQRKQARQYTAYSCVSRNAIIYLLISWDIFHFNFLELIQYSSICKKCNTTWRFFYVEVENISSG